MSAHTLVRWRAQRRGRGHHRIDARGGLGRYHLTLTASQLAPVGEAQTPAAG